MKKKVKQKTKKNLNLFAKIIAIIYIVFLTLFALDVPVLSWAFLIHLLPSIIFLGCLIFAWFKPKIGAILFLIAGLGTIIVFNTYREIISLILISLVPMVVGVLFWFSNKKK